MVRRIIMPILCLLLCTTAASAGSAMAEYATLTKLQAVLAFMDQARLLRNSAGQDPLLVQYCPYGVATVCVTPFGACRLGVLLCRGQPCYCPTFNGPIWGTAQ